MHRIPKSRSLSAPLLVSRRLHTPWELEGAREELSIGPVATNFERTGWFEESTHLVRLRLYYTVMLCVSGETSRTHENGREESLEGLHSLGMCGTLQSGINIFLGTGWKSGQLVPTDARDSRVEGCDL